MPGGPSCWGTTQHPSGGGSPQAVLLHLPQTTPPGLTTEPIFLLGRRSDRAT